MSTQSGPVAAPPRAAAARAGTPGGGAAGAGGVTPAVRETVEAIVRAVGAGDDVMIDRLLAGFTEVADYAALVHLRTRLHTALRATRQAMSPYRIPAL
ncbi:hypothetical protein [Streptomyces sp. cmx-4-9]|uniref:hypothetical protein n=1 Tax=Streptomyces sp. cmx-4-9 TaxID=2790941 RepID=UPI00397FF918